MLQEEWAAFERLNTASPRHHPLAVEVHPDARTRAGGVGVKKQAALAPGSDAEARAAMQKAIHPQAAPKAAPQHPAQSAEPAAVGTVTPQSHAKPLEQQWADAKHIAGTASPQQPAAADSAPAAAASEPLERQWADAMGLPSEAVHSKRRRQGLVVMPKGMSSVKRDGQTVLGHDSKQSDAAADSAGTSFHARAAAAVLEAYLGKHGGTESTALAWIFVGAAMVLGALVGLVASEVSVVSLVRSQSALEAAKAKEEAASNMGVGRDFSAVEESTSAFKYLAYRPYVTLVSMIVLFAGLVCLLSPVCEVLDIIGLPSGSCFLNVVFVAFVCTFAGTAFLMGCCWCLTRPYAALVLFAIALSGGVMCPTGTTALVVLWMAVSLAVFLFYFVFLPESDEVPFWCESVGPIKASMDPNVWERLATNSISGDWSPKAAYQYEYAYSTPNAPRAAAAAATPTVRKTVAV